MSHFIFNSELKKKGTATVGKPLMFGKILPLSRIICDTQNYTSDMSNSNIATIIKENDEETFDTFRNEIVMLSPGKRLCNVELKIKPSNPFIEKSGLEKVELQIIAMSDERQKRVISSAIYSNDDQDYIQMTGRINPTDSSLFIAAIDNGFYFDILSVSVQIRMLKE